MDLRPVEMRFDYRGNPPVPSPDAYEILLWDVMQGDATLFMRTDQVEAAWRAMMPVLKVWAKSKPVDSFKYKAGSWGPKAADELLAQAGHAWRSIK
jgi:glucose-6-phosphate 1-dehydrogenase